MRRLGFTSTYSVSCSLLEDKIVKATLSSIVNSKFNQLKFICGKGNDCSCLHAYFWWNTSDGLLVCLCKKKRSFTVCLRNPRKQDSGRSVTCDCIPVTSSSYNSARHNMISFWVKRVEVDRVKTTAAKYTIPIPVNLLRYSLKCHVSIVLVSGLLMLQIPSLINSWCYSWFHYGWLSFLVFPVVVIT